MKMHTFRRIHRIGLGLVLAVSAVGVTGCQVDIGGQTLPSPYYLQDDVQYFAPGLESTLPREASQLQAYQEEQQAP